ncbi:MAG: metal ABC transporter solute-binding protein, Zn/Mn family [Cyclobacteriaceae bacterium]
MMNKTQISCLPSGTANFKFQTISITLFSFLMLFSCSSTEKKTNGKLQILTTTQIIADGVEQIVGDRASVVSLMGSGVDPHLYKAAQSDMRKMNDADIIIKNGLHLEGKMADILHKYGRQKPVFEVSDGMDASLFRKVGSNTEDPHLWFNVNMWKNGLTYILAKIQEEDPANAEFYSENWYSYEKQLDSLDALVQSKINEIPEKQRVLITAHDAFGYFGIRYGMEVKGLQGLSTLANPGLKDIAELVDFIIERQIKAVFVETSVSEKNINVLVKGCENRGHTISIGGFLYSDALGQSGTDEGTYIGAVMANTNKIVNALK